VLENWAGTAPDGFRFAIKASRRITHMSRLARETSADSLEYLYKNLDALGEKRGPVLFQLPPFFKKDLPRLTSSSRCCPKGTAQRFEFRNESWFDDDVYDSLKASRCVAGASEREDNAPPPLVETASMGLRAPAARGILGRRTADLGGAARRDRMARDLRVLHARTDGAGVRAVVDERQPRLGAHVPAADEIGRALRAELLDMLAVCRQREDLAGAIRGLLALRTERQLAAIMSARTSNAWACPCYDVRGDRANVDIVEALVDKGGSELALGHGMVPRRRRPVYTCALFR
jgi:hypothetical protein